MLSIVSIALTACVSDDTTDGNGVISEITIAEGSVKEVYNIDKNMTLEITPVVSQTGNTPLAYTWEVGGNKEYSHEPVLKFTGRELGSFLCRLVVENADGKAFCVFTINVNSPYEEGVTVLSADASGKSMLSFMLTGRSDGQTEAFEPGDCFTLNNPEYTFAPGAADMAQCDGSVIVACKGGGGVPGTMYYLNEKTFVLENMVTAPEYPDFKPVCMGIPENAAPGSSYPILSEDGSVYAFSTTEGALARSSKYPGNYAPVCLVNSRAGGFYDLYLWDRNVGGKDVPEGTAPQGGLCGMINSYGLFYCSPTYNCRIDTDGNLTGLNYFEGFDFLTMFVPRPANTSDEPELFVIVKNRQGGTVAKVRFYRGWWRWSAEQEATVLVDNGGLSLAGFSPKLTEKSPVVASGRYGVLLFADGNKIYNWVYNSNSFIDAAQTLSTVGTSSAVITGIELSTDQTETYVAFYEPEETGLNGHVWVVDTDKGDILRKYDNICYRPVKIMYKKK